MKRVLVVLLLTTASAHARDAHVTAITQTTVYIDAGTADGLAAGAMWQATVDNRPIAVKVAATASHDAELEIDGAPPAVGATIALPLGLTPPLPIAVRPTPVAQPPWRGDPSALEQVTAVASREQPAQPGIRDETVVSGELSLSMFLAGDTSNSSTSWQDVALASQLSVTSGAWQYDHVLEAHVAGSPEVFSSPLQHAQAQLDVYLMRLAYTPDGARYAAALGRQIGAPLGELGSIDGARGRLVLDRQFDVTAFAGLRPASDLSLSFVPRAGADLGWQIATVDGMRVRADAGVAIDEYKGTIDRALTAAALSFATPTIVAHADAEVDLAGDASASGPRLTRASALVRAKRGRLTASAAGGYDRPFYDRALVSELPNLVLGPRTFIEGDGLYALRRGLDVGSTLRAETGDGFTSGFADVLASVYSAAHSWRATVAPHAIVGTLVDELGVNASLDVPVAAWSLGLGGSFDRVYSGGDRAWAELGRISGSRPFLHRWRTSLSLEVATGDGPARALLFGLLGYRFGK